MSANCKNTYVKFLLLLIIRIKNFLSM